MSEFLSLTCPHCGRALRIPAELEEFSCLYCGTRSRVAALRASQGADVYAALRAELQTELPKAVTDYSDYHRQITRERFARAFAAYAQGNRERMNLLDRCVQARPAQRAESVKEICADFLDALEAYMQADPRWARKRTDVMFEVKLVLAIFLTPLVRVMELPCAEDFRTELHRQWLERWPKELWQPGDYDAISAGFKRKLCFITTATCRHEGKPDDCAELTAFRTFRDGWLAGHGGRAMIDRYYAVAPSVVLCIELCDDRDARYRELRERWLAPCYAALCEERYEDCRDTYVDMVRSLEARYLRA